MGSASPVPDYERRAGGWGRRPQRGSPRPSYSALPTQGFHLSAPPRSLWGRGRSSKAS